MHVSVFVCVLVTLGLNQISTAEKIICLEQKSFSLPSVIQVWHENIQADKSTVCFHEKFIVLSGLKACAVVMSCLFLSCLSNREKLTANTLIAGFFLSWQTNAYANNKLLETAKHSATWKNLMVSKSRPEHIWCIHSMYTKALIDSYNNQHVCLCVCSNKSASAGCSRQGLSRWGGCSGSEGVVG